MRYGHKEAQNMFLALGEMNGYQTRRTYTPKFPTDGIWLKHDRLFGDIPFAAIEVIVSESPKTIRGSIATLEFVSPAIAIILIQDQEITRGLRKRGVADNQIIKRLDGIYTHISEGIKQSRQIFKVWGYENLECNFKLANGSNIH
tara:strand:- start:3822 stop:4256 length:435 start_codon:yes stop_codon:yes gene_type:complete